MAGLSAQVDLRPSIDSNFREVDSMAANRSDSLKSSWGSALVRCEWPKGAALGEGPVWDERMARLVWVDIFGGTINVFDPLKARTASYRMPWIVGSIGLRETGGYVVAKGNGFALLNEKCEIEWQTDVTEGHAWRFNDGKPDPQGNFWVGAMRADLQHGTGRTFRLSPDLKVEEVERSSTLPNGLAWVDQGRSLLYVDSAERSLTIYSCQTAARGSTLGPPQVIYEWTATNEIPDGLSIDRKGSIWVSIWGAGKVVRLSPDGKLEHEVTVPPSQPTSITFGGNDLQTAYVTSASCDGHRASTVVDPEYGGGLFSFRTEVGGVVADRFAG